MREEEHNTTATIKCFVRAISNYTLRVVALWRNTTSQCFLRACLLENLTGTCNEFIKNVSRNHIGESALEIFLERYINATTRSREQYDRIRNDTTDT